MSKKKEKFQLSIIKTAKDIQYEKPSYPNNLVDESEYKKIDTTLSKAVALTNAGTTLVREDDLPDLFAENKKDVENEKERISQFNKIGIMAGASTPKESIDEIVQILEREKLLKI